MPIVEVRARYRVRGIECSNYRWFRTTVPFPVPHTTLIAIWQTWVSYWAGVQSFEVRHYQMEANVYTELLNLEQEGHVHKPTTPIAGLIPLVGAIKPELCAGIVRVSPQLRRRIYMTGFPTEYVTDSQELNIIGELALATAENNIRLALDEVNVRFQPVPLWEPVTDVYVQDELMTHNHRKQHVPFSTRTELPG